MSDRFGNRCSMADMAAFTGVVPMNFIGILDGSGVVWGVRVPDVPGCHGGGETPADAVLDAISALRELRKEYGQLPTPRSMDALLASDEHFDPATEVYVMLPVGER
jgi:predicted RNase H-like HicB family nuclease